MVETTAITPITSDLNLLDKALPKSPFDTEDQSVMMVDSPRISSTPPSTPGLEEEEEEEEDMKEDEEEYRYNEYILDYESDQDEDFFFKDFATNTDKKDVPARPKSKRYSRRRRSQKTMSRFDLQSFARQLHENRLSVLQTRQSRMIMTEEDERELERLLARKYSRDDSSTPPVPALPSVPASSSPPSSTWTTTTTTDDSKALVIEPTPSSDLAGPVPRVSISSDSLKKPSILLQKLNDHPYSTSKDTPFDEATPLSPSLSDPSSFISPRRAPTPPSEASLSSSSSSSSATNNNDLHPAATTKLAPTTPTITIKKKPSWISGRKQPKKQSLMPPQPRKSVSVDMLRDQARRQTQPSPMETTKMTPQVEEKKPKLRLFGSLRQASRSSRVSGSGGGTIRGLMRNLSTVGHRQHHHQQQQQQQEQQQQQQEESLLSTESASMSPAAMAVIQHDVSTKKEKMSNKKEKTASASSQELDPTMIEGVDDSTVHVTHTATSTKGGVRLLSNLLAKARSRRSPVKSTKITNVQNETDDTTTITDTKERNKVVRRTIIYVQPDALDFMKEGHMPPVPPPKFRNASSADDDRYSKDTMMDDTSSTVEYATATKLTRQTSRRKRLVEESPNGHRQQTLNPNNNNSDNHPGGAQTKKWRLESVTEFGMDNKTSNNSPNDLTKQEEGYSMDGLYDYYHNNNNNNNNDSQSRLEGLELREMSDGSVVWGIVKKQGNRKSFFASKALEKMMMEQQLHLEQQQQQQEEEDAEKEHEQIEKSVLALMGLEPDSLDHLPEPLPMEPMSSYSTNGSNNITRTAPPPIPKRSPRRKCQQDNGLMDSQQDQGNRRLQRGLSVEEQLDEMMLSIKQSQQI